MAQTSQAKNKISQLFKKQNREENVEKGRDMVEREIKAMEFDVKDVITQQNLKRVAEKFNFFNEEDMYAAVGYNGVTALQVANRLTEKLRKQRDQEVANQEVVKEIKVPPSPSAQKKNAGVTVKGIDNLLIRLSRCCNPVPGDEIVGYITKGRGVSVHREDCPNVKAEDDKENRLIPVEWESDAANQKNIWWILKFPATTARDF